MTNPMKEKSIQSQSTSLLPRISSYYTNRTVDTRTIAGDINININSNNSSKWIEHVCKFINLLSTVLYSCYPFVIMIACSLFLFSIWYHHISTASAVGVGLFLLKIIVLDLFLFKMGKIQNWPNKVSQNKNKINQ